MSAPAWAESLVIAVCADAEVEPPTLAWRRRSGDHSTGVARRHARMIAVRAGADPVDQRLTLLHELAHWLAPAPRRRRTTHHGLNFYRIAFRLYRRHGVSDADAVRLEAMRYPGSLRHATALGISGAADALAAHREQLRVRPRRSWRVLVPEHAVRLARDGRWSVCEVCGQRVVGTNLARIRRARQPIRHVLLTAEPAERSA